MGEASKQVENIEMKLIDLETDDGKKEKCDLLLGLPDDIFGDIGKLSGVGQDTFGLNPEDVETYKEAFSDFDHKQDGSISARVGISLVLFYSNWFR